MTKKAMKLQVVEAIERNKERILALCRCTYQTPELGFREFRTVASFIEALQELGLEVEQGLAVTGCRVRINPQAKGPRIGLLAELDAIVVPDHPDAVVREDEGNRGAVHACGHNIQLAGVYGAVLALVQTGIITELAGGIDLIATPAEELIDLVWRKSLKDAGKIVCFSGKQEMIRLGLFDNIDICLMFHALDLGPEVALLWPRSNAFIAKQARFIGKSSHAGSAPELGVNALHAATLAIMNINAQRETFRDTDHVRVHYVITKGGGIVNVVPAEACMEITVRACNLPALEDAAKKVDRSLQAGALALGAQVEIENLPGYLPILEERTLKDLCKDNLKELGYGQEVRDTGDFAGSFDFGDLTQLMPGLHPLFGGVSGSVHTAEFKMTDGDKAVLLPAKTLTMMVVDLLADHAVKAKEIIGRHKSAMSKEDYLKYLGV